MNYLEIQVDKIIDRALEEDLGWGDVTTDSLIPDDVEGKASVIAGDEGVLAGVGVLKKVFLRIDPSLDVQTRLDDGERLHAGQVIAVVKGMVSNILRGERVALNFLQRMSGVATETARYVDEVQGLPVRIADTRKTAPGLRVLDKYAVKVGGGINHRLHLGDGILVKDNHLAVLRSRGDNLKDIVTRTRQNPPRTLQVEIEAASVEEAEAAAEAGADIVLLDNMDVDGMRHAVEAIRGRSLIEASGGITLGNVRQVAEAGVDFISVGSLTHSAKALDISLEIELS